MTDTTKLPPLPERECSMDSGRLDFFTAQQMREYGAECRCAALEEAAKEFDRRDARNPGVGFYEPSEPAQIIRTLKDKA